MHKINLLTAFFIFFFSSASFAKCTSFYFGVNSVKKNEFAFFECKTKQVFQNSDLFFKSKNQKNFFIGESKLTKPVDFKKISKALTSIIKKSKVRDLKQIVSTHGFHLTIGKQTYQVDHKNFKNLSSILQYLNKRSKQNNGVLVKNKKFYSIKNRINKGPINSLKLKLAGDFYFYNGLYWSN
jgi:hypothetical protein